MFSEDYSRLLPKLTGPHLTDSIPFSSQCDALKNLFLKKSVKQTDNRSAFTILDVLKKSAYQTIKRVHLTGIVRSVH